MAMTQFGPPKGTPPPRYTEAQQADILRDYADGMNIMLIREKYGCSEGYASKLSRRAGAPVRRQHSKAPLTRPTNALKGGWTEARVELLKELHAKGLVASFIGKQLGVSKNAIIGKLGRLGLGVPREKMPKAAWQARPHPTLVLRKTEFNPGRDRKVPQPVIDLPALPGALVPKRLKLWELTPRDCKWPVAGMGEHTEFCGHDRVTGRPYCERHTAVAYRVAEPPRIRSAAA